MPNGVPTDVQPSLVGTSDFGLFDTVAYFPIGILRFLSHPGQYVLHRSLADMKMEYIAQHLAQPCKGMYWECPK